MNLALKDVRHSFGRFALTTAGISMLLLNVIGLRGIYRGIVEDARLLVDRIGADLWVVQRDTRGPFVMTSQVPKHLLDRVSAVPGVASAKDFMFYYLQYRREGKTLFMAVVGLSWPNDKGDWLPLMAGRSLRYNHFEMIADESLKLPLGARLKFGKESYTLVGITRDMINLDGDGIAFLTVGDAHAVHSYTVGEAVRTMRQSRQRQGEESRIGRINPQLVEEAGKASERGGPGGASEISAVLVKIAPGADIAAVRAMISSWPDVTVYTREDQCELVLKNIVDKARRQIQLFSTMLTSISALIMALILYTLTLARLRSIALLKLIGAPNRLVLGIILQQAVVLGGLGYGIGYLVGQKVFPYFPRRVIVTSGDMVELAVIVFAVSVLASGLGIWRTLRVHPSEVLSG